MALLPLRATAAVGNVIGALAYYLRTPPARNTAVNLRYCFPELTDEECRTLVRQSLKHTGRLLAESGIAFHWPEDRLNDLIVGVDGFGPLQEALDQKRGILVLVPHFGNWELFALHFGRYRFMALYDPPRIAAIDRMIRDSRQRTGAILKAVDVKGIRAVFQTLKKGDPVSLLPDQVPSRSGGVHVPFFGHPALTMTFVHRLVRSTDPLVVLGSCLRLDEGFRITFSVLPDAIYDADVAVSAAAMNQAIEELVRADPAQYQWEYKRFKKPPAGELDIYKGRRVGENPR